MAGGTIGVRTRVRWAISSLRSCVALRGPDFSAGTTPASTADRAALGPLAAPPSVPLIADISLVVTTGSLVPTCTSTPRSRNDRSTRITTNPDSPVSRSRSPTLRRPSTSDTSARSSGFSASRSTFCPSGIARIASKLRPASLGESDPDFMT